MFIKKIFQKETHRSPMTTFVRLEIVCDFQLITLVPYQFHLYTLYCLSYYQGRRGSWPTFVMKLRFLHSGCLVFLGVVFLECFCYIPFCCGFMNF